MKLGLAIGYSGATMDLPVKRVQLAERLGYDSVWPFCLCWAGAIFAEHRSEFSGIRLFQLFLQPYCSLSRLLY